MFWVDFPIFGFRAIHIPKRFKMSDFATSNLATLQMSIKFKPCKLGDKWEFFEIKKDGSKTYVELKQREDMRFYLLSPQFHP